MNIQPAARRDMLRQRCQRRNLALAIHVTVIESIGFFTLTPKPCFSPGPKHPRCPRCRKRATNPIQAQISGHCQHSWVKSRRVDRCHSATGDELPSQKRRRKDPSGRMFMSSVANKIQSHGCDRKNSMLFSICSRSALINSAWRLSINAW